MHSDVLAGVELEHGHGLAQATQQGREKVGEQHVKVDIILPWGISGGSMSLASSTIRRSPATTFASDLTGNMSN